MAALSAQADSLPSPLEGWWREVPGAGSVGLRQSFEKSSGDRFRLVMYYGRPPEGQRVVEGACDGNPYPFTDGNGKPVGITFSCRAKDARTMEYIYTQEGATDWVTSTGTQTVSADGRFLQLDTIHRDGDGKFVENLHRRFERQPPPR